MTGGSGGRWCNEASVQKYDVGELVHNRNNRLGDGQHTQYNLMIIKEQMQHCKISSSKEEATNGDRVLSYFRNPMTAAACLAVRACQISTFTGLGDR